MKTPTTTNDTTLILPEAIIEAYNEDWNLKGWGYKYYTSSEPAATTTISASEILEGFNGIDNFKRI